MSLREALAAGKTGALRGGARKLARSAVALGVSLATCALCGLAGAQTKAADAASAEALFDQSLKLMESGRAAEACPKLEASQRMDPGVGTLLYLADCYQQVGKTASAWATFREAAYAAKAGGQADREAVALEYAKRLKPTLGYVVIEVAGDHDAGLQVSRDGQSVGEALWGTPVPVDPGPHVVEVTASGKKPWRAAVEIPTTPGVTTVTIPGLEDAPAAPPAPVAQPAQPAAQQSAARPATAAPRPAPVSPSSSPDARADSGGSAYGTWGWILGGAGVASLATSAVFSLGARTDDRDADAHCRVDNQGLCNETGVSLSESASQKASVATITGGVGLALLATGVTFLLIAPDDDEASDAAAAVWIQPELTEEQASVELKGVW